MEVGPLIKWGDVASRLNPYPLHYRTAFAFSTFLYPHRPQHSLRFACPKGRRYGLTVFHVSNQSGLDSAFPPAVLCPCVPRAEKGIRPRTFWFKPVSILWLVPVNDVYQQFK